MIFDGTPAELKDGGSLAEPFYRLTNYGRPIGAAADLKAPVVEEDVDLDDDGGEE